MADSKKDTDKNKQSALGTELRVSATTCPRCSIDFVCNAANIQQCQCWGLELKADDFAYLKQQGFSAEQSGCLCRDCLLEIQREARAAANNSSST